MGGGFGTQTYQPYEQDEKMKGGKGLKQNPQGRWGEGEKGRGNLGKKGGGSLTKVLEKQVIIQVAGPKQEKILPSGGRDERPPLVKMGVLPGMKGNSGGQAEKGFLS